jgi:predicted nuclease of predicted toxin-antitoxin system
MRLLLDECVPEVLRRDFVGHTVESATHAGFKGLKNGQLLAAMAGKFDCLITVDKSIPKQQNLEKLKSLNLSIIILRARSNRYEDLKILVSEALNALESIGTGEVKEIT